MTNTKKPAKDNGVRRWLKRMVMRFSFIFEWYQKRQWIKEGCPMIKYDGFHCGLCGKWVNKSFEIPKYKSLGKFWDTWGICDCE